MIYSKAAGRTEVGTPCRYLSFHFIALSFDPCLDNGQAVLVRFKGFCFIFVLAAAGKAFWAFVHSRLYVLRALIGLFDEYCIIEKVGRKAALFRICSAGAVVFIISSAYP